MTDFWLIWANWMLVFAVAGAPFSAVYGPTKLIFGDDTPPVGCVGFCLLGLLAGPFAGYWAYVTFDVVRG